MRSAPDIKLSVLDLALQWPGVTAADALRESVDLAKQVERLGYTRYWFAEHHNTPWQASSAPELLIAHVAAHTSTLRIGSGGVMLPNHSPLKVVENFRTLEALHPGRIDLGIGRGPGADDVTAQALRRSRQALTADDFSEQMAELLGFFTASFPENHPFQRITPTPVVASMPELWMLGSGSGGAQMAAEHGLALAFAHHIAPDRAVATLRDYRRNFQPSRSLPEPRSMLSVNVFCAETDAEAQDIAALHLLEATRKKRSEHLPPATLDEARAYRQAATAVGAGKLFQARALIGTIDRVASGLQALAEAADVDEFILLTMAPDHAARLRSYEMLAEVFELQPHVAA
jgi:luciferase family oxidoreductase group 1